MKNILVITNFNYMCIGGVENYNRLIYSNFSNFNFYEYVILENNNYKFEKLDNVFNCNNSFLNEDPIKIRFIWPILSKIRNKIFQYKTKKKITKNN